MSYNVAHLLGTTADFIRVCDDGGYLGDHRLIGDAYAVDDIWFFAWFIDVFVTDKVHKRRFLGCLRAVDDFARDFAKLHHEKHGEPLRIPPEIINELKRYIVRGYWPGVDEIVLEAKHGQPLRAQQALMRTMREDAWRKRS